MKVFEDSGLPYPLSSNCSRCHRYRNFRAIAVKDSCYTRRTVVLHIVLFDYFIFSEHIHHSCNILILWTKRQLRWLLEGLSINQPKAVNKSGAVQIV